MKRKWSCPALGVLATASVLGLLATAPVQAQGNREMVDLSRWFEPKRDVMVPMRDGVRLHTEIYIPKDQSGPLPIMLERTPYFANPGEMELSPRLRWYTEFFDEGYIFVLQDLRGRYLSEGEHVTLRPNDPDGVDESTDFYDTIEWLIRNVPDHNGRVGTWGISYGGFLATRAMVDPHPALRAVSPQATCADMFVGDDFHHNGAFRLSYSFVAAAAFEARPYMEYWDRWDTYDWFLDLGPLSNVNDRHFRGVSPTWNAFVEHPNKDAYWDTEICGVVPFLQGLTVPALHVTGWYDTEDFYGPIMVYRHLEQDDRNNENFLVLGPWTHGGWTFDQTADKILDIDLGGATAQYFRKNFHAPWFAYWLKDKGPLDFPEATAFQTGSNEWQSFGAWPPVEGIEWRNIYLREDGGLSFDPPATDGDDAFDVYVSDPDKPVPFRPRPIRYPYGWPTWQAEDQRFVHGRPDVLSWESEPLEEDLSITGDAVAHLFASTTGTSADWVVKLIDVYPDDHPDEALRGYQYMVAGEVLRARFRNSFERPEPLTAGEVTSYDINLRDRNHRFLRGHRIMVQIQSTWFPIIDRNPQSYVPNIFLAGEGDFRKAEHRVYRNLRFPTHIALPVNVR